MKFKIPFISKNAYIDYLKTQLDLVKVEDYTISSNGRVATFNIQIKDERKVKKLNKDYPLFLVNQLSIMQDQTKRMDKLTKEVETYYKKVDSIEITLEEERRLRGLAELESTEMRIISDGQRALFIGMLSNIIKEGQVIWKGKVGQKFGEFILSKF